MRVLVAVGSKHGATYGIAEAIGEALTEAGIETTVSAVGDAAPAGGFDALVIGSAVYAGHWTRDARSYVERNAAALAARPVWLFSSGPVGDPPMPDEDPVDVADLAATTGAVEHRVFAGKLDKDELGFGERAMVKAFRAPEGDFRDWPEIREWANAIAEALREPLPA